MRGFAVAMRNGVIVGADNGAIFADEVAGTSVESKAAAFWYRPRRLESRMPEVDGDEAYLHDMDLRLANRLRSSCNFL